MENRSPMYMVFGLALGFAIGFFYALFVMPAAYVNSSPAALEDGFKDQYRMMAVKAYDATGDFGRVQSRLALLQDADPAAALDNQAQKILSTGGLPSEAQMLANMARLLRSQGAAPELPQEIPPTPYNPMFQVTATLIPGANP